MEELVAMNNVVSKISLATWLIADDQDGSLGNLMNDLTASLDAPKFEPHITMSFVQIPSENIEEARKRLETIAHDFTPITLVVKRIDYADNLFQSLFLRFEDSAELSELYERIGSSLAEFGQYTPNPHLSILYKEMSADKKEKIIPSLQLPTQITFSKLGLNVLAGDKQLLDVEGWNIKLL
jgi:2'-5' RNA ligase